ncbi:MAG: hypothetical protein C1943_11150 [Halochromatium sp.]|nr:hypothetical protein [Halochromatium sp.]
MTLAQEDIEFIKAHIGDWLAEQSLGKPPAVYEIELRERMVRVEEELKHQRELMREGFALMDKRFEAMQANMDQRFEQVDKRFESVQQDIRNLQQRMDSFMRWSFGITIGVGGVIIGVLKLWP